MPPYSLDAILDLLNEFHQRATYGAVAALVDRPAHYLMGGRPRDHRHSWIVNQDTRLPAGYSEEERHPFLTERDAVISSPEELEHWVENPSYWRAVDVRG